MSSRSGQPRGVPSSAPRSRGFLSLQVVDSDMITIEDGATVGRGTVVLYGADIGDGAQVLPHGVVMKHEVLLPGRRYVGAPTREL